MSNSEINKLEVISIVGESIPATLEQILKGYIFDWHFNKDGQSVNRINHISNSDEIKKLVHLTEDINLQHIILLTANDQSYLDIIKWYPQGTRVMVYLDNPSATTALLKNPSMHIINTWKQVAIGVQANNDLPTHFPTHKEFMYSVAVSFTDWLSRIPEAMMLKQNQVTLSEMDFTKDQEWHIHKDCPLIRYKDNQWLGAPSNMHGFSVMPYINESYSDAVNMQSDQELTSIDILTDGVVINDLTVLLKQDDESLRLIISKAELNHDDSDSYISLSKHENLNHITIQIFCNDKLTLTATNLTFESWIDKINGDVFELNEFKLNQDSLNIFTIKWS